MLSKKSSLNCIGLVTGTFGIKGELKIRSTSDTTFFLPKSEIILIRENDFFQFKVGSFRIHKGAYLITLDEIKDINQVIKYIDYEVYTSSPLAALPENMYYIKDLIGLPCYVDNVQIGEIVGMIEVPNGFQMEFKIYETKKTPKIPFVEEFVEVLDDRVNIYPIEGLF
jgi:16S rRNA processing protein RimM